MIAEKNEIEAKKTIAKINETKILFSEKIKLINLQSNSSRRKGGGSKNKIRNKKVVTMNTTVIQRTIRDYYRKLYKNKMNALEKNGKILRKVQLSKSETGKNRNYEQMNHK